MNILAEFDNVKVDELRGIEVKHVTVAHEPVSDSMYKLIYTWIQGENLYQMEAMYPSSVKILENKDDYRYLFLTCTEDKIKEINDGN